MGEVNTEFNAKQWREQSKADIVKAMGLEERGQFDYALPQDWVDEMKKITGIYATHCFVWFYPRTGEGSMFGRPYPLTDEGRHLLQVYNQRKGTTYPIY